MPLILPDDKSRPDLQTANRNFRRGHYGAALAEYEKWQQAQPALAANIEFNVRLCKQKIRSTQTRPADSAHQGPPCISVIVPAHNVEQYIDLCLWSLRSQTLAEIEIIIVDDGSTDATRNIVRQHMAVDQRIVLHASPGASGNSGTPRNLGIEQCSGEYVAFIDADDWVEPDMLHDLYTRASQGSADIISGAGFFREWENGTTSIVNTINNGMEAGNEAQRKRLFLSPHFPIIWFRIYRRNFLLEQHIRFAETPTSADMPFSFAALLAANHIDVVDKIHYHYRFNRPGSTLDKRKGRASFQLVNAYQVAINHLAQRNLTDEYLPYLIYKALGDYGYNRSFLMDELKPEFDRHIAEFLGVFYPAVRHSPILDDANKALLDYFHYLANQAYPQPANS